MADYTLPELPYDYGALDPHISGKIMELHHSKHHQAYVTGINQALEQLEEARSKESFGNINLLLSSRVHSESKILFDRTPAERVAKVDVHDIVATVCNGRVEGNWPRDIGLEPGVEPGDCSLPRSRNRRHFVAGRPRLRVGWK